MSRLRVAVIIILCLISIASGSMAGYLLVQKTKDNTNIGTKELTVDISENIYDNLQLKKNSNILIVTINGREQVINLLGQVIDENEINGKITLLYDDYYTITNGTDISLKRNGQEIVLEPDYHKLYKDPTDENAFYISPYFDAKEGSTDTIKLAKYNESYEVDKSFLYNSQTGEVYVKGVKNINAVYIQEEILFYSITRLDDSESLVSIDNLTEELVLPSNYYLVSDETRLDDNIAYKSGNKEYFIVLNNGKYGLINKIGDTVITPKYNDLYFNGSDSGLIIALKNKKYGIINSNDEVLLDFEYDGILIKDDYLILLKDNSISTKTIELKSVGENLIPYSNIFNGRSTPMGLNLYIKDNYLIIQTDNNTSIFNKEGIIKTFEVKNKLVFNLNKVIDEYYIVTENIDNNAVKLIIYDFQGKELSTVDKTTDSKVNLITYNLLKQNTLKISFFNESFTLIEDIIVSIDKGESINSNVGSKYSEINKLNDYYYVIKENNELKILSRDYKEVGKIEGELLYYLNGNTYTLYKDTKWYLLNIRQ